ncbi:hypothetical protein [Thiohalorhabdus sp.]|uniref:hypothetical protein n=1 Tax=Thiohalorhabdus sp. TaxID=3094134 RepID=UPI002FC3D1A1
MAEIEWVVGIMRAGDHFHQYGDPYDVSATVLRSGDHAEVLGASGRMSRIIWRSMVCTLLHEGITTASWTREDGRKFVINTADHCRE